MAGILFVAIPAFALFGVYSIGYRHGYRRAKEESVVSLLSDE